MAVYVDLRPSFFIDDLTVWDSSLLEGIHSHSISSLWTF